MPRIVAFVGIDGVGKTSQARLLTDRLNAAGIPARYWRNAAGRRWLGRVARRFRRRDAEDLLGTGGLLTAEAILRWLAIARALLGSWLTGRVAVMDRYTYCQYAAIRARGGRREGFVRRLYRLFPAPDLTVHLSLPVIRAYDRIEQRGTDHEDPAYLAALDTAYRSLPELSTFVQIDADRPPETVHSAVWTALAPETAARVGPR